jgi:hypothetical protein
MRLRTGAARHRVIHLGEATMKRLLSVCLATLLALSASVASAAFHLFEIEQVYSNADGTVQYVMLTTGANGEGFWSGHTLTSTGPGPQKVFKFPNDLPTNTQGHHVLVATQGFAALGLVTPDYVIPDGFLQIPNGTIDFAGVSRVTYTGLPNDGVNAIDPLGKATQNRPTNFAGASTSLVPANPNPLATVVEYYWASRDHYFISSSPAEIAALDTAPPGGWVRTGKTFHAYAVAQPGTAPVCRFYLPVQFGDSHFYGRSTAECDATHAAFPGFVYESPAVMYMVPPVLGVCPAGTVPVYRVFDGRADANHRYMIDPAVRNQMLALHWQAEGDGPDLVVMCAPQ